LEEDLNLVDLRVPIVRKKALTQTHIQWKKKTNVILFASMRHFSYWKHRWRVYPGKVYYRKKGKWIKGKPRVRVIKGY
jgi:hypothetical protein